MKIFIWSNGDPDVGIEGCSAIVEIDGFEGWGCNQEEQLDYRRSTFESLEVAFKEIFDDGRVHIMFEDEKEG